MGNGGARHDNDNWMANIWMEQSLIDLYGVTTTI